MQPRIHSLAPKQLMGICIRTTQAQNRTVELWRSFMPRLKEITGRVGHELFSVQFFDPALPFAAFNDHTPFDKWAAAEVNDTRHVPPGMQALALPGGEYAVFVHRGPVSAAGKTLAYIYGTWLPTSAYEADNRRAHFAVMGEKYRPGSPDSEEEIWVPIKGKE